MHNPPPDSELIDASLQRPAEFAIVFERHWEAVFRFFEGRLSMEPAEDLASEVFRVAFERRTSYESRGSRTCLPWLYGIAGNLALKERRRFARHLAATHRLALLRPRNDDDHASAVTERLDSEHTWSQLRAALVSLDDTAREMRLLVAWEGLLRRGG